MIHVIEDRIKEGKFVLIAEAGVNYYDIASKLEISPMDAAKLMIKRAAESGIHAIKFQSYKAETLASEDSPYYWDLNEEPTDSQYKLFKKFDSFGEREYQELADTAEECGIEFLSTAFDIDSADYLQPMMNVYKISSSDLNNLDFVEYQAKKDKPIIMSVGASNFDEIKRSVDLIRRFNSKPLILMHCVLEYPTPYEHANLDKIVSLKSNFPDLLIGYSDHTRPDDGYDVLKTAYNLGATVIEKHYTLDKTLKGNDHYHAMDEYDAKRILERIDYLDMIRGDGKLVCLESEQTARKNARRSLVASCDIQKGTIISRDMLTWKRPASGISADEIDKVIGKTAVCDIVSDTVLQNWMFK